MMTEHIFNLYKRIGETPLQTVERFKKDHPEYQNIPLTYAGRLDPMAEGVLLVLAGEEVHNRQKYLELPKTYEALILWGVETDTYDILGIVQKQSIVATANLKEITKLLTGFQGKMSQSYPPYSSKPVLGKPLFQWAREGKIAEIEIPEREVEIFELTILNHRSIQAEILKESIFKKIALVSGDFRQESIVAAWKEYFADCPVAEFLTTRIKMSCSSGTYVRALVHEWGSKLGCGALALAIIRTAVGDFKIDQAG